MKPLRWKQNDDKEVKKYLLMSKNQKLDEIIELILPATKTIIKLYWKKN